jgi:hypothetical protein
MTGKAPSASLAPLHLSKHPFITQISDLVVNLFVLHISIRLNEVIGHSEGALFEPLTHVHPNEEADPRTPSNPSLTPPHPVPAQTLTPATPTCLLRMNHL